MEPGQTDIKPGKTLEILYLDTLNWHTNSACHRLP
jgi:hypothetical protein